MFLAQMDPFLAGRENSKRQQVVDERLQDDAAVWHRQFEEIDVTW